ncbi:CHAD domain protein [mine drainage metagenome]|uniref:CHAD domain protein n=1 Tax=mine drainage metagenome TaxID=410659 RepID=A0A1J5SF90_9ZZZZ
MANSPSATRGIPHLRKGESLGPGLRRVVLRCVTLSGQLAPGDLRAARVRLKRARAALHLAAHLSVPWALHARRTLARMGRHLGPARDRAAAAERARACAESLSGKAALCARAIARIPPATSELAAWIASLERFRKSLESKSWPVLKRRSLAPALAAAYRRLHHKARRAESGHSFHPWRKAAIDLREQLNVADPFLDSRTRAARTHLHHVARNLGLAGDWDAFIAMLDDNTLPGVPRSGRRRLARHARTERKAALRSARRAWRRFESADLA